MYRHKTAFLLVVALAKAKRLLSIKEIAVQVYQSDNLESVQKCRSLIKRTRIFFSESKLIINQDSHHQINEKYEVYFAKKEDRKDRLSSIVDFATKSQIIDIQIIAKEFPRHSRRSLQSDLKYLVSKNRLLKTGNGRTTKYRPISIE